MIKLTSLFVFCCLITAISHGQSPDGSISGLAEKFYAADDLAEKLQFFNNLQVKAPDGTLAAKSVNYDDMRRILALNYLQKDSIEKYQYYIEAVHNKVELADQLDKMTSHMTANKKVASFAHQPAASMVRLIEEVKAKPLVYKPAKLESFEWINQIKRKEIEYKARYALILYREEKYDEAIGLLKPVYDYLPVFNLEVFELYAKLLKASGNVKQSTTVASKIFEAGYQTDELMQLIKANYKKTHAGESGLDAYLANIKQVIQAKTKVRFKSEMTSVPAPAFSLKNMAGKVVSLSNLIGKVIVIDFWATWCMPCKESFPAAQRVINHYGNDSEVEFLFIDTWENDKAFETNARKFITDSKYSFNVLFDEIDSTTAKQELVSKAFRVDGIPTRIIIDKKGKICFTEIGYSGSLDQTADDLITRVELAKDR